MDIIDKYNSNSYICLPSNARLLDILTTVHSSNFQENDEEFDPEDYDDTDPRKPPPKQEGGFDPSKFKDDPMAMIKMTKKGKTIMVFVQVAAKFDKKEADKLTERWHHSLFNAQFQMQRLQHYKSHDELTKSTKD